MLKDDEVQITLTGEAGKDRRLLGHLKCPDCQTEQPVSVDSTGTLANIPGPGTYKLDIKDIKVLMPWACEHLQKELESEWKASGKNEFGEPIGPTCQTCGQPNAHNLSIHGLTCDDCRAKQQYVCDFCTAPKPPWAYPTRDFRLSVFGGKSTKGWAACDDCRTLIDSDQKKELSQRAVESYVQKVIKE